MVQHNYPNQYTYAEQKIIGSLLKISSTHDMDSDDEEVGDFITGSFCPECNLFWVGNDVSGSY